MLQYQWKGSVSMKALSLPVGPEIHGEDGQRCRAPHPCSQHRRAEAWWPADTSDGNAVGTDFRVSFDLSYTLNTHENRFTKPLMAIFCAKLGKTHEKALGNI